MQKFPEKYVLTVKPKKYLQQGLSHCGAYSVKAILSAYDLDTKDQPEYYHPHWIGRLSGLTFGRDYFVRILKQAGVNSKAKTAENISNEERITLLKKLLSRNTPVMIRTGYGYSSGKYNRLLGKLAPHWITLWGYNDEKREFYVYDSGLNKKFWSQELPIGNTIRTYEDILRDWRFGKWHPYNWLLVGNSNYLYIEIESPVA